MPDYHTSGSWGAVTAAAACTKLAFKGFTGAPAITVENAPEHWIDLGQRWYMHEQYYKPYPVCRWAQAPIEAALTLLKTHALTSRQIRKITIETFHESIRLATVEPKTTEEAQYSTSFPVAIAIARGNVTPADIADDALSDPEILRLSHATEMLEFTTPTRLSR